MTTITQLPRQSDGTYPAYAWPGGYPIYYLAADNGVMCPTCANSDDCRTWDIDDKQWCIVASGIHWEGYPIVCDNCNADIGSAYGPIDDEPLRNDITPTEGNTMQATATKNRLTTAFQDPCFPCNPIPFAIGLADLVKANGTDSIKSDDAKSILWILMAQAYGQLATIDLMNEWQRLDERQGE